MASLCLKKIFIKHVQYALCFVCLLFQSSVTAKQPSFDWQASFFQDHELVGKIWDTHKNTWLSPEQLEKELKYYDYILMGEIHDHPDHHTLQAELINSLVSKDSKPTIVMEMLSQQAWVDQPHIWRKSGELKELASMLNEGWPWDLYSPILQSIVQHQLMLFAGNIASDELHRWSNENSAVNEKELLREYTYTEDNFGTLKNEIIDSHCGHANQKFVNFMSRAQMQRDRIITESLLDKDLPVVLIAGSGHVRNDYAVPMQLRNKFQLDSYLSIAFVPVEEGENNPQTYMQEDSALYDILYFTPSHTNEDPCDKFRKQLKNMQHKEAP